jgi:hypothetical protein
MLYTVVRLATATALACSAGAALAQAVIPPPLPPGSNLVRPEIGLNEEERKRYVRAHHHKMHHGKDFTKDDSVHGHEHVPPAATRPVGTRATGAAGVQAPAAAPSGTGPRTVPGGAGTGPAREKTDRGASSWFFGNDKKK